MYLIGSISIFNFFLNGILKFMVIIMVYKIMKIMGYNRVKDIALNSQVSEEVSIAAEVACNISNYLDNIIDNIPEVQEFRASKNIGRNRRVCPVRPAIDSDIFEACLDIIDFQAVLNDVWYEEVGMWDTIC